MKALSVNVCNGTAKSAENGSRDMRVSTGQHADCAWGEFPFIYRFVCVGGVLVGVVLDSAKLAVSGSVDLVGVYRTTTLTVLRGQFPIYIWIFVDLFGEWWRSEVVVLGCIVSRSV